MVDTKSLDAVRKKWEAAIGRVPAAYSEGVSNAKDVIAKGVAAEDVYAQRLQETIASRKRARELAKVTDTDWKNAAINKGAARIGPGMTAAKEGFGTGIQKVLSTIQGVSLPPRTADAMTNVDQRVKPIVAALKRLRE